jgi:putative membrane protein
LALALVEDEAARRRLLYRHFAWLTALRFQLREPRGWENMQCAHNVEYRKQYRVLEWECKVDAELAPLLDEADLRYVLARKNRATHLIQLQSRDVSRLTQPTPESELRRLELERVLAALVEAQGKCERIKNFPYPRQFATLNHFFIWLLILLVPLGLLPEFLKFGEAFVWLTIPASVVVSWVFHTMDKIGEATENPFEGGPNDVPITALSRTIEIDMREMLGETELPEAIQPVNSILM